MAALVRVFTDEELERELERRKAAKAKHGEGMLAPKPTKLSEKAKKELGLKAAHKGYSYEITLKALEIMSTKRGRPAAVGAEKCHAFIKGAIPLGTLKKWRVILKPLRGTKLTNMIQELLTRSAGNPNLKPYMTKPEKRMVMEYVKERKNVGRGLDVAGVQGTTRPRTLHPHHMPPTTHY